jgi:seryl-tRNA synthetase
MSISESQRKGCIAVDQDADHDELVDAVVQLVEQNREIRQENRELRQEVDDLREDHADHVEQTARERAEDRKRLTDVEQAVEEGGSSDVNPTPKTDKEASTTPQTPLEQTAGLPQEMIDQETANVRRAVFVAADLDGYTTKVPAGRAIRSSELRRVLKAGTDCRGHSQTVDRVMSILDDLGGDDVQVVDRRGERRVVFTEQIVTRLQRLTAEQEANHDVVAHEAT